MHNLPHTYLILSIAFHNVGLSAIYLPKETIMDSAGHIKREANGEEYLSNRLSLYSIDVYSEGGIRQCSVYVTSANLFDTTSIIDVPPSQALNEID